MIFDSLKYAFYEVQFGAVRRSKEDIDMVFVENGLNQWVFVGFGVVEHQNPLLVVAINLSDVLGQIADEVCKDDRVQSALKNVIAQDLFLANCEHESDVRR